MDTKRMYQFYALIHGKYAYVGKSYDSRLDAVKWRHQRGENKHTKKFFSKSQAPDLKLVHLTTVHTDHHEAHRYVLAFIRLLLDHGYILLNSQGMLESALDLYPASQRLLTHLACTPLTVWLGVEPESSPPNCDTSRVSKRKRATKPTATESLSLRLYPHEMLFFKSCAEDLGVSRHFFLAILLETYKKRKEENPDWTCSDFVEIFMRSLQDQITIQEKEMEVLKEQVRQLKKDQEHILKQRELLVRAGIGKYMECFIPLHSNSPRIPVGNYHRFLAEEPDATDFTYPDTEDFFIFYPTNAFYGSARSSARFIIGTNEAGKKTLLRFYSKPYYAGLFIFNEKFGLAGSRWLVRAEKAADGAMDIVFSLPIDVILKDRITKREEFIHDVQSAIEDAIRRSESLF